MKAVAVRPGKREVDLINHETPRVASPTHVKLRMLGPLLSQLPGLLKGLPGIDGPKGMPPEKLEVILTDQAYIGKHREELKAKYRELFELK